METDHGEKRCPSSVVDEVVNLGADQEHLYVGNV